MSVELSTAPALRVEDLRVFEGDNDPRILDKQIGWMLGYKDQTDVRELIDRYGEQLRWAGDLPYRAEDRIIGKPGPVGKAYWLNEKQALFIISKSETPFGNQLLQKVIDVFYAYRRGHLAPAQATLAEFSDLFDQKLKPVHLRLAAIEGQQIIRATSAEIESFREYTGERFDEIRPRPPIPSYVRPLAIRVSWKDCHGLCLFTRKPLVDRYGREIPGAAELDHADGDRTNNRFDNLILMDKQLNRTITKLMRNETYNKLLFDWFAHCMRERRCEITNKKFYGRVGQRKLSLHKDRGPQQSFGFI